LGEKLREIKEKMETEEQLSAFFDILVNRIPWERACSQDGVTVYTDEELLGILQRISFEDYKKRYTAVRLNFEAAKSFIMPELWGLG
jgi:hypothetical protein